MDDSTPRYRQSDATRICSRCGQEMPNTREYFYYANAQTKQLRPDCVKCLTNGKNTKFIPVEELLEGIRHLPCPKGARLVPLAGKYGVGKAALVDESDFAAVMEHRWLASLTGYATITRRLKISDTVKASSMMHRFIMGESDLLMDHINRNRLDNRRCNLRYATASQNAANTKMRSSNTSGFRGVWWNKNENVWQAEIGIGGRRQRLGVYATPQEAAAAYDAAAIKAFGEFASLNFPH